MLVIENIPYAQRVPTQLGTLHVNRDLDLVSKAEMINLSNKWKSGKLATLLANKSAKVGKKNNKAFPLDHVKGRIKLTKAVEIAALDTVHVLGLSRVKGASAMCKCYY